MQSNAMKGADNCAKLKFPHADAINIYLMSVTHQHSLTTYYFHSTQLFTAHNFF